MENEKELLEIAKNVLEMNKELNPMLTGSLMLYVRGIDKRREAHDIDILVNQIDYSLIKVPDEFYQCSPCYPDAIQFTDDKIKIDFLLSEETPELINQINCGSVKFMMDTKYRYSQQTQYQGEAQKHLLDLEYLHYKFPVILKTDDLPW